MAGYTKYFDANRDGWNKKTLVHKTSSFYDVEKFKKGVSSLNRIELDELGDVQGKTLLHLQCHFGMDTLSWARLGALVTGVDFSEEAIKYARELAAELQIPAAFICENIYDLLKPGKRSGKDDVLEDTSPSFDRVFTSYGTIGWLPDLDLWARVISGKLNTGGIFYMADFHPVLWMLDDKMEKLHYSYFNDEVIESTQTGTYADRYAAITYSEFGWNHPLSGILNSLIHAGLQIEFLHEFPFSPYNCFNNLEQDADGMWRFKGMNNKFPMVYSIRAKKV